MILSHLMLSIYTSLHAQLEGLWIFGGSGQEMWPRFCLAILAAYKTCSARTEEHWQMSGEALMVHLGSRQRPEVWPGGVCHRLSMFSYFP